MLHTNNFIKGLATDIHPKSQEDGTYRFALNLVLESKEGDLTSVSNEEGNYLCATNFPNKTIIGHVQTDASEVILFLYDSAGRPEHEIGSYNPDSCTYTTIAKGACLNFSDKHPINAIFKVRNGCDKVVFFTDNYNPYRVVNISDTEEWVDSTSKFIKSCDLIAYSRPSYNPTTLTATLRDFGGNVTVGVKHFAIRFLDSDENPTDYKYISPGFPVADESFQLTTDPATTFGYDGGSNDSSEVGYVPITTKSIELLLYGLDTSFAYYQIAVLKRDSTDGTITAVDLLYPTPMPQSALLVTTDTFIYTGQDSQVKTSSSLDDVLVPNQRIEKVAAHAQLNRKLYVANATNTKRDYSILQAHASSTKVEYVKKAVNAIDNNVKSPTYYFKEGSFMPDEIYALGRVYVYNDGTESPVFHIPGRAPNTVTGTNPYIPSFTNWDTDSVSGNANVYDNAKVKRWQVYNTATKYASAPSGADVGGLMGYYETPTYYPEIETCSGDPYWGTDWQGNVIDSNTHIRHHRMPSTELYKTLSDRHYRIGIKFTDTQGYPDPDIREHYFVYSDRTYERTVLDRGILSPLMVDGTNNLFYQFPAVGYSMSVLGSVGQLDTISSTTKSYGFTSNQQSYLSQHYTPSYFKVEKVFSVPYTHEYATVDNDTYQQVINARTVMTDLNTYVLPSSFNYKVTNASFLDKKPVGGTPNSSYLPAENRTVENRSINTPITTLSFSRSLDEQLSSPDPQRLFGGVSFYGVLKADTDVFQNLSTIRYRRIPSAQQVLTTTPASVSLYGGDTFVTYTPTVDFAWVQTDQPALQNTSTFVNYITDDDYVNSEFRHGDPNQISKYGYFHWNFQLDHGRLRDYIATKYHEEVSDVALFYPEQYLYNKSYSHISDVQTFYPLPYNYKYCDDCTESFPFRVYYSQTDTTESTYDPYRVIRVNDYKDNDSSDGPVTDLFTSFNNLYLTTARAAYMIPTRPQTLSTNQDTVYIGTSENLSLPFHRLSSNTFAFGGQELFKSRLLTEYGAFYIDSLTSRPILLTDKLNDLSLKGTRSFWQENGLLILDEQFKAKGSSYTIKSTSARNGIGYSSTYDARYKRILINKKDYAIRKAYIQSFVVGLSTTPSTLYFYGDDFYFRDAAGNTSKVYVDDSTYFDNVSFTLSYSFLTHSWVSYHSYLPSYMFNTHEDFFTVRTYPYKHLDAPYQTYYGTKYDHILDLITKLHPMQGKQANNIYYSSTSEEYSSSSKTYALTDTTFDRFVAYNSNQSTGIMPLSLKTPFATDTTTSALVDKVDSYYRISNIRDRVIDPTTPIWSKDYSTLSPYFYIDAIPNPNNIGSPSFFENPRFRDTYMGVRLYFNPTTNTKITTDLTTVQAQNKNR